MQRLRMGMHSIEEITPLAGDDFLIAARRTGAPLVLDLTRVRAGHEEIVASTPALFPSNSNASAFRSLDGWWFSRQGGEGRASRVFFVAGGEAIRESSIDLTGPHPLAWLPIRGDQPRGIAVSVADEQPALRLDEVTPAGVKPLAAFPWWDTGFHQTVLESRWSAEALPRGRIAVVAVDGPPSTMTLVLRVAGGVEPVEAKIPCGATLDYPLATAADPSGRIAVVGVTRQHAVMAVLIDSERPKSAVCRVVSAPAEIAAQPPFGTPSVIWANDRFVAGWIRSDGVVRACELGSLQFPPLVVDVGEDADTDHPLRQLLSSDDATVAFVWRERGGNFLMRRFPDNLTGYSFAEDLLALLRHICS